MSYYVHVTKAQSNSLEKKIMQSTMSEYKVTLDKAKDNSKIPLQLPFSQEL